MYADSVINVKKDVQCGKETRDHCSTKQSSIACAAKKYKVDYKHIQDRHKESSSDHLSVLLSLWAFLLPGYYFVLWYCIFCHIAF